MYSHIRVMKHQALSTLRNLAWFHDSRVELQNEQFLKSMIEIVNDCGAGEEELAIASWTLVYMLFNWESTTAASDVTNLLPALRTLSQSRSSEILLNTCMIIRLLCEHTAAARRAFLPHIADLLVDLSTNCQEEARAYHITAVIYLLMNIDKEACQLLCNATILGIVKSLAHHDSVCNLVAAIITCCSLDPACKEVLAQNDLAPTLVMLMECAKEVRCTACSFLIVASVCLRVSCTYQGLSCWRLSSFQECTICNIIVSVYTLSKLQSCRDSFVQAGAAQSLYRLSNEPSSKVRFRAWKAPFERTHFLFIWTVVYCLR